MVETLRGSTLLRSFGLNKNKGYKDSGYTIAADLGLDIGKAGVAGAAGFLGTIATSAALWAAYGSAVPVWGTAVGLIVGLGLGIYAAAQFE